VRDGLPLCHGIGKGWAIHCKKEKKDLKLILIDSFTGRKKMKIFFKFFLMAQAALK